MAHLRSHDKKTPAAGIAAHTDVFQVSYGILPRIQHAGHGSRPFWQSLRTGMPNELFTQELRFSSAFLRLFSNCMDKVCLSEVHPEPG
jgi:hypothetical protein